MNYLSTVRVAGVLANLYTTSQMLMIILLCGASTCVLVLVVISAVFAWRR